MQIKTASFIQHAEKGIAKCTVYNIVLTETVDVDVLFTFTWSNF